MNPLVRRYLRTAIAFLALGLLLGVWMLYAREFGGWLPLSVRSAHTHALIVGFVMVMITGVALWMFPRPRPGDAVFWPELATLAGGVFQTIGAMLFTGTMWTRIRGSGLSGKT